MVAVDGLSSLLTSVSEPNSLTACGPIHWCSLENVWKNPLQALCVASAPCSLYPHLTSLCENTALLLSLCHFFPFRLLVTEGAGIGERRHNQPVSVSATCRNSQREYLLVEGGLAAKLRGCCFCFWVEWQEEDVSWLPEGCSLCWVQSTGV